MTSGERVELSKAILLSETLQGFFLCSQGLHSHLNLGDFFPNFEKKSQSSKKKFFFFFLKIGILFYFLKIGIFIQSTHTDTTW